MEYLYVELNPPGYRPYADQSSYITKITDIEFGISNCIPFMLRRIDGPLLNQLFRVQPEKYLKQIIVQAFEELWFDLL